MRSRVWSGFVVACGVALIIGACGGNNASPTPTPGPTNTSVPRGSQVTFINNDNRTHDMESDPHPEHTDCPAINQVGTLNPGQSRQSGNLNIARVCGFHDHDQAGVIALQ